MSWSLYLINNTKKVVIRVGKTTEEEFLESVEIMSQCLRDMDDRDEMDVNKKVSDLTIEDVASITKSLCAFESMSYIMDSINAASLFLYKSWGYEKDSLIFKVDPDLEGFIEL